MDAKPIPVSQIALDPGLQPRVDGLDAKHVRELEAAPEHWPPVSLVARNERLVLVDGFHRLQAAKNLRLNSVRATVLQVAADADLHALAFTLNASHGRPLSLKDRRVFAARLLTLHPNWSDREIGRESGLVQPTVAKLRSELERRKEIPLVRSRVGRDGRSYAVARTVHNAATALERLVDAYDPNEQRRIVRYLERLTPVLEEQDRLRGFEMFDDAARACILSLGEKRARELGHQLGWTSQNILGIARALGYRDGSAT
jgi:hypothetical protein